MRLLNIHTFKLEEFFDAKIPPYYILSHRWGEREVSYKDYMKRRILEGPGYRKIIDACALGRKFEAFPKIVKKEVNWIWIDTCCIDKRSSAELSEAINSMFRWYQNAVLCFVHLADVDITGVYTQEELASSSWFTRGWTLQELLAPRTLVFLDASWRTIGHVHDPKHYGPGMRSFPNKIPFGPSLLDTVSDITRIPKRYVERFVADQTLPSIAQRMSWASRRQTTRIEDEAYCLLGIFQVNIPLLYGEGRRAFLRLQEEIIRHTPDQSIFAWRPQRAKNFDEYNLGMLALSPEWFLDSGNIVYDLESSLRMQRPFTVTNNGLELITGLRKTGYCIMEPDIFEADEDSFLPKHYTLFFLELNCKRSGGDRPPLPKERHELPEGDTHKPDPPIREEGDIFIPQLYDKEEDHLPSVFISLTTPKSHSAQNRYLRCNSQDLGEEVEGLSYEQLAAERIYIKTHTQVYDIIDFLE